MFTYMPISVPKVFEALITSSVSTGMLFTAAVGESVCVQLTFEGKVLATCFADV